MPAGNVPLKVPRDRNGEFEPRLVPKHARRIPGFNDMICGLLGRGMSTRDICAQMQDTYGVEMSPALVSDITDAIMPRVADSDPGPDVSNHLHGRHHHQGPYRWAGHEPALLYRYGYQP